MRLSYFPWQSPRERWSTRLCRLRDIYNNAPGKQDANARRVIARVEAGPLGTDTRINIVLPSSYPYRQSWALLAVNRASGGGDRGRRHGTAGERMMPRDRAA